MKLLKKFKMLSKTIKRFTYASIALILYTLFGFFLLPIIVQPLIIDALTENLNREVSLEKVEINPFTLSISLTKLSIAGKDSDQLFSLQQLKVNFQATSLVKKIIAFDEISISQPELHFTILEDGEFNFQDLISKNSPEKNNDEPENTDNWTLAIDKFRYIKGRVYFTDMQKRKPFKHQLKDISIALDDFSTKSGGDNIHHIKALTGRGTKVDWRGDFSLSPFKSSGDISIEGGLKVLSDYLQDQMRVKIVNGKLDLNSHYQVSMIDNALTYNVSNTLVSVQNLEVRKKSNDKKVLSWHEVSLNLKELDSVKQKITFNQIASQDIMLSMNINKLANFDVSDLFVLENMQKRIQSKNKAEEMPSGPIVPSWKIEVINIDNSNAEIIINDNSTLPSAKHQINIDSLTINNLHPFTDEVALLQAQVEINQAGSSNIKGSVKPNSKIINLEVNTKAVVLKDFQSYINGIVHANVNSGSLSTNIKIAIDASTNTPKLNVKGDMMISDLNLSDKTLNEEFLSWNLLAVKGINFDYPEQNILVGDVYIKEPYLRLIMGSKGSTNIGQLLVNNNDNDKNGSVNKSTDNKNSQTNIKKINIKNGKMDFSDLSLKPQFSAGIYSLHGNVLGLSSSEGSRATIDLKGKVDKYAPVIIKGSLNPLSHQAYTDIEMLFKGIELTTFTPYSGKFAGYRIDKGKLSLYLDYQLSKNKLVAENRVVLEQLTLGDPVDSNDATSLPVKFALSLLKDANGVIDFNLPIRGDIDQPDFHYGSLVWGALGNLVTGIISSPFRALASLVGSDDDNFDQIIFSANSSELTSTEKIKLGSLANALKQRPSLYLEIRGLSSNLIDHDKMAEAKVLKELALSDKYNSLSSDELTVVEKEKVLAYHQKLIPLNQKTVEVTPSNTEIIKNVVELSAEEKALLFETKYKNAVNFIVRETKISPAEYLSLAKQRAQTIQQYIIEVGLVPSANVYLLGSSQEVENQFVDVENGLLILPLNLIAK